MMSSFVFRTPPLFCTLWWWASVGVCLNWMITSTVPPLGRPLRASISFDSLRLLPSARHSPATSSVIRTSSATRAPQVVVFRTLSLEDRDVSNVADISWPPKITWKALGDGGACSLSLSALRVSNLGHLEVDSTGGGIGVVLRYRRFLHTLAYPSAACLCGPPHIEFSPCN